MNALDILGAIRFDDAIKGCAHTLIESWRKEDTDKTDTDILREKLASVKVTPEQPGAPKTLEALAIKVAGNFVKKNIHKV